uniref:Uncharacterized protein n=1 Tax=Sphaerodactylus townsendi TaxID=933632 RepID=A0ACB8EJ02_9SAUR
MLLRRWLGGGSRCGGKARSLRPGGLRSIRACWPSTSPSVASLRYLADPMVQGPELATGSSIAACSSAAVVKLQQALPARLLGPEPDPDEGLLVSARSSRRLLAHPSPGQLATLAPASQIRRGVLTIYGVLEAVNSRRWPVRSSYPPLQMKALSTFFAFAASIGAACSDKVPGGPSLLSLDGWPQYCLSAGRYAKKSGWGQHLGLDTSLDIHWLARHAVVFCSSRVAEPGASALASQTQ